MGRGDAKEAIVGVLGDDLLWADGRDDDACAGEGDAQRQGGGGKGSELHSGVFLDGAILRKALISFFFFLGGGWVGDGGRE